MKKEKIKVYLYTRVSTTMQIDGYSLDAQKTKMKAFCDYNEYEIAGEYEDAGKFGKSIEGRVSFNQMMEDIKSGKDGVSYVLVFKLSRFGRNEYRQVKKDDYLLVDGLHEALVSEEVWEQTQVKVAAQAKKYEKVNRDKREKIHLLSGILKCPVCGAGMYGNKSIKKRSLLADKITGDNIYKAFVFFDKLYAQMNEAGKREFLSQLVDNVQIYDERKENGQWLKSIEFKLPIIENEFTLSLDNDTQNETVVLLSQLK